MINRDLRQWFNDLAKLFLIFFTYFENMYGTDKLSQMFGKKMY